MKDLAYRFGIFYAAPVFIQYKSAISRSYKLQVTNKFFCIAIFNESNYSQNIIVSMI